MENSKITHAYKVSQLNTRLFKQSGAQGEPTASSQNIKANEKTNSSNLVKENYLSYHETQSKKQSASKFWRQPPLLNLQNNTLPSITTNRQSPKENSIG